MIAALSTILFVVCLWPMAALLLFFPIAFAFITHPTGQVNAAAFSTACTSSPVLLASLYIASPILACAGLGALLDRYCHDPKIPTLLSRYGAFLAAGFLVLGDSSLELVTKGALAASNHASGELTALVLALLGKVIQVSCLVGVGIFGLVTSGEVVVAFLGRAGTVDLAPTLKAVRPLLVLVVLGFLLEVAGGWIFQNFMAG